jgi:uncharacterized Zn-binding protein involved in type VI secretion
VRVGLDRATGLIQSGVPSVTVEGYPISVVGDPIVPHLDGRHKSSPKTANGSRTVVVGNGGSSSGKSDSADEGAKRAAGRMDESSGAVAPGEGDLPGYLEDAVASTKGGGSSLPTRAEAIKVLRNNSKFYKKYSEAELEQAVEAVRLQRNQLNWLDDKPIALGDIRRTYDAFSRYLVRTPAQERVRGILKLMLENYGSLSAIGDSSSNISNADIDAMARAGLFRAPPPSSSSSPSARPSVAPTSSPGPSAPAAQSEQQRVIQDTGGNEFPSFTVNGAEYKHTGQYTSGGSTIIDVYQTSDGRKGYTVDLDTGNFIVGNPPH